jgi:predicted hotdog family 3-hydroxylacyl-ACP dehydratase
MMKDALAITRDKLVELIPHAGAMCLLDGIVAWDDASIQCVSTRHRALDNPLRQAGRLGALCGIEFAGQAMAAHGRLTGAVDQRPRAGVIASLRDVVCHCERLDSIDENIMIDATLLMGDEEHVMYSFSVTSMGRQLLSGRATVILRSEGP